MDVLRIKIIENPYMLYDLNFIKKSKKSFSPKIDHQPLMLTTRKTLKPKLLVYFFDKSVANNTSKYYPEFMSPLPILAHESKKNHMFLNTKTCYQLELIFKMHCVVKYI